MKMKEFVNVLEKIAPLNLAQSYDAKNGIQIEGSNREIKKVMTCLDVTPNILKLAEEKECQMVISHHQPIISPLNVISRNDWYSQIVVKAIECDITVYSVHTPFDAVYGGLNDYVGKLLGLRDMKPLQKMPSFGEKHGMGRTGLIYEELPLDEFAQKVSELLEVSTLKIVGNGALKVRKVAVGTGNGLALMNAFLKSDADVYITGDLQYRDLRDAFRSGKAVIAVEHDDTEKFFAFAMKEAIEKSSDVKVTAYNEKFYHTLE